MRKYATAFTLTLAVSAVAGFFIRRGELKAGFDFATGLAVRGASVTGIMLFYCALVFLCALVFAIITRSRFEARSGFSDALAPAGSVSLALSAALGISLIVAGIMMLRGATRLLHVPTPDEIALGLVKNALDTGRGRIMLALAVLCAGAGFALPIIEISGNTRRTGGLTLFFAVIPELFCTVWLIDLYRQNQINPVLLSFVFRALAIVCAAMCFYYTAAAVYERPAPAKFIFFHVLAVFLCAVSLADALDMSERIVFIVFPLYLLFNFWRYVRNLVPRGTAAQEAEAAGIVNE
jgi:hypothetical protein